VLHTTAPSPEVRPPCHASLAGVAALGGDYYGIADRSTKPVAAHQTTKIGSLFRVRAHAAASESV